MALLKPQATRPPRRRSGRFEGRARLDGERGEVRGVGHGDLGQHLAVELDVGQLEAVHELVVRQAVLTGARVDADDPQLAELALAHAAVAVGVLAAALDLLFRPLVGRVLSRAVALGLLEHLAALLARGDASFDSRHGGYSLELSRAQRSPSRRLISLESTLLTSYSLRNPRLRLADLCSRR